jgi:hypothetical protein
MRLLSPTARSCGNSSSSIPVSGYSHPWMRTFEAAHTLSDGAVHSGRRPCDRSATLGDRPNAYVTGGMDRARLDVVIRRIKGCGMAESADADTEKDDERPQQRQPGLWLVTNLA